MARSSLGRPSRSASTRGSSSTTDDPPFWPAPRLWPGQTVVILGGGPSLCAADVDRCRGRARVIAINDAWRLAPWADALYAADLKWWEDDRPGKGRQARARFGGLKIRLGRKADEAAAPDVLLMGFEIDRRRRAMIESDPRRLAYSGGNSGSQAINLALHFGATRALLLGFDMAPGPRGELHWHGRHPHGLGNPDPDPKTGAFPKWLAYLAAAAPLYAAAGLAITNCSRATALTAFPRAPIEDCL